MFFSGQSLCRFHAFEGLAMAAFLCGGIEWQLRGGWNNEVHWVTPDTSLNSLTA
jgi:hypothetical protein